MFKISTENNVWVLHPLQLSAIPGIIDAPCMSGARYSTFSNVVLFDTCVFMLVGPIIICTRFMKSQNSLNLSDAEGGISDLDCP